ncbi:hypothetical protein PT286_09780 [Neisseriaceae bacterium ESL0693]|nr:hypothetical protein [Neisseriaceae bacterium ESL0693]
MNGYEIEPEARLSASGSADICLVTDTVTFKNKAIKLVAGYVVCMVGRNRIMFVDGYDYDLNLIEIAFDG